MKNLAFTILLLLSLGLSACSYSGAPIKSGDPPEMPLSQSATPERQALFVYGQKSESPQITLYIGADPQALSTGYIRLVGVVGETALLEIGGRGAQVGVGDKISEYVVQDITESEVKLCLGK